MDTRQSRHLIIYLVASVITFDAGVQHSSGQLQQQQVQYLPINNWNCNETEKLCAVDDPSEKLQTSSLSECTMRCWMKHLQCMQFNYYFSASSSSNCALFNFQPKKYAISADCQHYMVGAIAQTELISICYSPRYECGVL